MSTMSIETLLQKKKEQILLVICLFVTGFFCYFKQITEVLANPDAIWMGIFYKAGWQWECSLGRFMIKVLQDLRGHTINTSLASLLCLLFLCIGSVLLTEILQLTSFRSKLFTGLLIVLSVNTGCLLTYYYCSDMYAFSFLCVIAAVYLLTNCDHPLMVIPSALLIAVSCAIYQAYVGTLLTVTVLYFIRILPDKDWNFLWKRAVKCGCTYVSGMVFYLVANRFVLHFYRVAATENRGFSTMGVLHFHQTLTKIREAYVYFWQYYFGTVMINNNVGHRRAIHAFCFLLLAALILLYVVYVKQWWKRLLFLGLIAVFPLAVMSIHVMAPEADILDSTGVLMLTTMFYVYILAVLLGDTSDMFQNKVIARLSSILLYGSQLLVLYAGVVLNLSGQAYLEYATNKTDYLARSLASAIEQSVDHSSDYHICIVGAANTSLPTTPPQDLQESLHWTTYSYGTIWANYNATQQGYRCYISDHLGVDYQMCSQEEYNAIKESGILENMALFPDEGSVYVTEEQQVIIKLSDPAW